MHDNAVLGKECECWKLSIVDSRCDIMRGELMAVEMKRGRMDLI
jgi:hypothetical protein